MTPLPLLFLTALMLTTSDGCSKPHNLINQCPQRTSTNPDPHEFMFSHSDDCRCYFICGRGQPVLMQCKPNGRTRYSEFYHTCVAVNSDYDTCTRLNAHRECTRGFQDLIGHPSLCHRYFNCSQSRTSGHPFLAVYEDECPYPQLFDIETRRCAPAAESNCGFHRARPKDACDYAKVQCTGSRAVTACDRLEDGFHPMPGQEWTKTYISCYQGRLVEKLTCQQHEPTGSDAFFSPVKKKCVSRWEVPTTTGYGLQPSCNWKQLGVYRTAERKDVHCTAAKLAMSSTASGDQSSMRSNTCVRRMESRLYEAFVDFLLCNVCGLLTDTTKVKMCKFRYSRPIHNKMLGIVAYINKY